MSSNTNSESKLFLKYLNEEGISEVLIDKKKPMPIKTSHPEQPKSDSADSSACKNALIALRDEVLPCTKCDELSSTRKNVVFGAGNVKAKLMFVGEAPGRDEDEQGLPFVGRAGQLLTKIIESIGLSRKDVFIANVLKCRPPQNRQPAPQEVLNCQGYLVRQIEIIQPKIICCLGTFAAQTITQSQQTISSLRGRFYDLNQTKVICTYHPAYLLRNPSEKRAVWEDMKKIKTLLDETA